MKLSKMIENFIFRHKIGWRRMDATLIQKLKEANELYRNMHDWRFWKKGRLLRIDLTPSGGGSILIYDTRGEASSFKWSRAGLIMKASGLTKLMMTNDVHVEAILYSTFGRDFYSILAGFFANTGEVYVNDEDAYEFGKYRGTLTAKK